MSASSFTLNDVRTAAQHTRLLLKLRRRIARQRAGRARWVALILGLWVFASAASAGSALQLMAAKGIHDTFGFTAIVLISQIQAGTLTTAAGATIGFAIVSGVVNPFTGGANNTLMPDVDLATVRPHKLRAWTDSLATTAFSLIGLVQLVSLTFIGSILSVDGGRFPALIASWMLWPVVVLGSSTVGWTIELVSRSLGPRIRTIAMTSIFVTIGLLGVFVRDSRTMFGIANAFSRSVRAIAGGDTSAMLTHALILTCLSLALAYAGARAASAALLRQPIPETERKSGKAWLRLPVPTTSWAGLYQTLFLMTLRTKETRRPLSVVGLVGLPTTFINGDNRQIVLVGILSVIPASVALAWPVNSIGLIGPGMSWLGSQPNATRQLPSVIWAVHVTQTVALGMLAYLPGTIYSGHLLSLEPLQALGALFASGVLMASYCLRISIRRPYLARLGGRGDTIVPPAAGLGYTLRLMAMSQLGACALGLPVLTVCIAAIGLALIAAALLLGRALADWSVREVPATATAVVAAI